MQNKILDREPKHYDIYQGLHSRSKSTCNKISDTYKLIEDANGYRDLSHIINSHARPNA